MVGHVGQILAPFLGLAGAGHWCAGEDVEAAATRMDATSATKRSMVTICSPDAARMADSRWLRRRASRLDMGHDVVSPRQICPHPTPKSNSALVEGGL